MKYIPVFHPFGVALRSKSVPDGFVTKDFAKEWNNRVYFRLSKMLCGFKDQVRARPSGETGGLHPAPASRDPGEKCGLEIHPIQVELHFQFDGIADDDIQVVHPVFGAFETGLRPDM